MGHREDCLLSRFPVCGGLLAALDAPPFEPGAIKLADDLVLQTVVAALRTSRHHSIDGLRSWLYATFINLHHTHMLDQPPCAAAPGLQQPAGDLALAARTSAWTIAPRFCWSPSRASVMRRPATSWG